MYQRMGIVNNYFDDRGNASKADFGRYNITGDEKDIHVFKVPSLRLVAYTAPYFHDGSAQTLEDAVQVMGYYQLESCVFICDNIKDHVMLPPIVV